MVRYVLISEHVWLDLLTPGILKPGLYNWYRIFNGEVRYWKEVTKSEIDLEDYDIVHVNMSAIDFKLPSLIRKILPKSTSTLLIVNMDYAPEILGSKTFDIKVLLSSFKAADFIFAQTPFNKKFLEVFTKRRVYLIPHPVDTKALKQLVVKPEKRMNMIFACYHRYDSQRIIPAILASKKGFVSLVLGVDDKIPQDYFAAQGGYLAYEDYLEFLKMAKLGVEYYTMTSHGRFANECACLKIPLIGTDRVYNNIRYYPRTTFPIDEIDKMIMVRDRLLSDEDFYDEVIGYAYERVESSNYENSRKLLLGSIEEELGLTLK